MVAIEDIPAPIPLARKDKIEPRLRQTLARAFELVIRSPYLCVVCVDVHRLQMILLLDGVQVPLYEGADIPSTRRH